MEVYNIHIYILYMFKCMCVQMYTHTFEKGYGVCATNTESETYNQYIQWENRVLLQASSSQEKALIKVQNMIRKKEVFVEEWKIRKFVVSI